MVNTRADHLRPAHPWPFTGEAPFVVATVCGIGTFIYGGTLISHHAHIYQRAGVAGAEAGGGALVTQALVLLALLGTGVLYRRGYPMRMVWTGLALAGVLAVVFALLPYLVAGRAWLDTLLGVLITLLFNLILAGYAVAFTAYVPLWWEQPSSPGGDS